mmetsp:Transcript_6563/g.13574  ORF Transcript_6563/g.13574 Transcript_6563/m.13574 type:complete len:208 (+) Transcript_6563:275-898(+)
MNLSPKGTSWEMLEDSITICTSSLKGLTEKRYVVVILVVLGHMGAGGTGTRDVASRIFTVPPEELSAAPSSIQGAGVISVAPNAMRKSMMKVPTGQSLAKSSSASGPRRKRGKRTSQRLLKGSPSSSQHVRRQGLSPVPEGPWPSAPLLLGAGLAALGVVSSSSGVSSSSSRRQASSLSSSLPSLPPMRALMTVAATSAPRSSTDVT